MHRTFSIVIDVQICTEPIQSEEDVIAAVIDDQVLKSIQNTLENAIEIRKPTLHESTVKLWDLEKIKAHVTFMPTNDVKTKNLPSGFDHTLPLTNQINNDSNNTVYLKEISNNIVNSSMKTDFFTGSKDTLRCLTKFEAQKMCVFPLQVDDKNFICATTTESPALVNKLRLRTGKKVVCVASPLRVILNSIEKAYHKPNDTADRDALLSSLTKI